MCARDGKRNVLLVVSVAGGFLQLLGRLFFPDLVSSGITTVLLTILFFGAINLSAIALVGEYIAKIFEEVKHRPHFIRRSIIREGEIRLASDAAEEQRP